MYLLSIHKVPEAIHLYAEAEMFPYVSISGILSSLTPPHDREAIALAQTRLGDRSAKVNDLYGAWAAKCELQGNYEQASKWCEYCIQ